MANDDLPGRERRQLASPAGAKTEKSGTIGPGVGRPQPDADADQTLTPKHCFLGVSDIMNTRAAVKSSCPWDFEGLGSSTQIHPLFVSLCYILSILVITATTSQDSIMASPQRSTSQTLEGKVAIVTGASRGLGLGFAFELARRGAKVRNHPPSSMSQDKH